MWPVKSHVPVVPTAYSLADLWGTDVTWNDLQKNRLVKQKLNVVGVVVVLVGVLVVAT